MNSERISLGNAVDGCETATYPAIFNQRDAVWR